MRRAAASAMESSRSVARLGMAHSRARQGSFSRSSRARRLRCPARLARMVTPAYLVRRERTRHPLGLWASGKWAVPRTGDRMTGTAGDVLKLVAFVSWNSGSIAYCGHVHPWRVLVDSCKTHFGR
eukprot:scaffold199968_cov36-Tisochrysis_lutea.AAC.1